jgi:hypothetical protein
LAEYFVAFKFAAELGCLAPEFVQTYCEANGQPCEIPIQQKDVTELAETFGLVELDFEPFRPVINLLPCVVDENMTRQLWKIVDETRSKPPEKVGYASANAINLLRRKEESFVGLNFRYTVLTGANLSFVDLTRSDFRDAYLDGASLGNAILEDADFRQADLRNIAIRERYGSGTLTWSTSGKYLAFLGDNMLSIWNTYNYQEEFRLQQVRLYSLDRSIQFVPHQNQLLFARQNQLLVLTLKDGEWCIEVEKEFEHPITNLSVNENGTIVAICNIKDKIVIWNRRTQSEDRSIDTYDTHDLLFVPNSTLLIEAHSGSSREFGKTFRPGVRVWDLKHTSAIWNFKPNWGRWSRCNCDIDRLGRVLVSGAFGGKLMIWDLTTFSTVKTIDKGGGHALACSPDGTTIAAETYSYKPNIKHQLILIDISTDGIRLLAEPRDPICSLVFSPDGKSLASVGFSGKICIWDVDQDSSTFGQCVKVLEVRIHCKGIQISEARGLEEEMESTAGDKKQKSTLLEFFAERGAVLDEKQKRRLAELKQQRKTEQNESQ